MGKGEKLGSGCITISIVVVRYSDLTNHLIKGGHIITCGEYVSEIYPPKTNLTTVLLIHYRGTVTETNTALQKKPKIRRGEKNPAFVSRVLKQANLYSAHSLPTLVRYYDFKY